METLLQIVVEAKVLNYDILVSKFELHTYNYVHFRHTPRKTYESPLPPPPALRLNNTTTVQE